MKRFAVLMLAIFSGCSASITSTPSTTQPGLSPQAKAAFLQYQAVCEAKGGHVTVGTTPGIGRIDINCQFTSP